MDISYDTNTVNALRERFAQQSLHRPMRPDRYEPGDELTYTVTGVVPKVDALVRLVVDKFVGGGFAGQVYRVKVLDVQAPADQPVIPGLEAGRVLAMKILIPPSGFSKLFRDVVYAVGFQGPFQLQVNPAAVRAGALWQKFIRRAAKITFGDEGCVNDLLATFVDSTLGSCGELSEWVEGRTWRLEVDDHVHLLKSWRQGKAVPSNEPGSPEYRAKYEFMHRFVELLHELGAHEFARQYEWSTCKSQPNCLKRTATDPDPQRGLIAVDFRAGLALLPFLPMSPGDFKLIGKGLARGSLVQFDRGSLKKLKTYIDAHPEDFADLRDAYNDLVECERIYRDSLPDVTHNHVRLLSSGRLWSTMFASAVTGWRVRNLVDEPTEQRLRRSKLKTFIFFIIGLLPLLGRLLRRLWARPDYRRHYGAMLGNFAYFCRALRGRIHEKLIFWLRAGRITDQRALSLSHRPGAYFGLFLLSWLPAGLFRFLTDSAFFRTKLDYIFIRPFRLLFKPAAREAWLREMVEQGRKNHLLTDEDAATILSQLKERYIQVYLVSLAVHVCTLPITQIVSVAVATWYLNKHPELTKAEAAAWTTGILAAFQITPVSPGSFCRGLYVLGLVIYERNIKDYKMALSLGFFKYIGYLAFPLQMAYRYPVLARFMAAHWATGAVHIVPVFGEKGALLEHGIFNLFYNWPLTLRRRMQLWATIRKNLPQRHWHIIAWTFIGSAALATTEWLYVHNHQILPTLKYMLLALLPVAVLTGFGIARTAGGTPMGRRILQVIFASLMIGLLSLVFRVVLKNSLLWPDEVLWTREFLITVIKSFAWRVFILSVVAAISAVIAELTLPEPTFKPTI
ncbi:MAG: hypothetical protein JW709_03650 [Sedimentisphaerales bacterium]|nr:hypothetical protein [Sedimentisphaerales bacterium]